MVDTPNLNIPDHLVIARQVRDHVTGDWTTNAALIGAVAELEAFVRTPPSDELLIDLGVPLDPTPITKRMVGMFENRAEATNGKVSYGLAAVQRLRDTLLAMHALELKTQELEQRLAQLENDTPS